MGIFKVLFELFILYILYIIIFDFIIPVYNATKGIKRKVADMQNTMNKQQQSENATQKASAGKPSTKPTADYIDFEEIKN
jgi:hypothetical protein